jgi:hypothetical protein
LKFVKKDDFNFRKILSHSEILGHIIKFSKKNLLWVLSFIFSIALLHSALIVINEAISGSYYTNLYTNRNAADFFFYINAKLIAFIAAAIALSLMQILLCVKVKKLIEPGFNTFKANYSALIIYSFIISVLLLFPFYFGFIWGFISWIILGPFLFLSLFISHKENIHFFTAALRLYDILDKSWGKLYLNALQILIFIVVLFLMLNTQVGGQIIQSIYINFNYSGETMYLIKVFIITSLGVALMALFGFLLIASSIFTYSSIIETVSARNLKERIQKFGERNNLYGFEKE